MEHLHPLPHYKWYWEKFRLSRAVRRMDYIQRGLYRDLLDEQWENGSVSGDIEDMADLCGCPVDVMASAWQVLERCFTLADGCYKNDFLEQQRTAKDAERIKRRESGKKGGDAKAQRNQQAASKCQARAKQILAPSQDKIRLDKRREEEKEPKGSQKNIFLKPTLEQVREYCRERKNAVDPERFCDHYESNGWKVGKNPMRDWKAAVRTWEKSDQKPTVGASNLLHREETPEDIERKRKIDEEEKRRWEREQAKKRRDAAKIVPPPVEDIANDIQGG